MIIKKMCNYESAIIIIMLISDDENYIMASEYAYLILCLVNL